MASGSNKDVSHDELSLHIENDDMELWNPVKMKGKKARPQSFGSVPNYKYSRSKTFKKAQRESLPWDSSDFGSINEQNYDSKEKDYQTKDKWEILQGDESQNQSSLASIQYERNHKTREPLACRPGNFPAKDKPASGKPCYSYTSKNSSVDRGRVQQYKKPEWTAKPDQTSAERKRFNPWNKSNSDTVQENSSRRSSASQSSSMREFVSHSDHQSSQSFSHYLKASSHNDNFPTKDRPASGKPFYQYTSKNSSTERGRVQQFKKPEWTAKPDQTSAERKRFNPWNKSNSDTVEEKSSGKRSAPQSSNMREFASHSDHQLSQSFSHYFKASSHNDNFPTKDRPSSGKPRYPYTSKNSSADRGRVQQYKKPEWTAKPDKTSAERGRFNPLYRSNSDTTQENSSHRSSASKSSSMREFASHSDHQSSQSSSHYLTSSSHNDNFPTKDRPASGKPCYPYTSKSSSTERGRVQQYKKSEWTAKPDQTSAEKERFNPLYKSNSDTAQENSSRRSSASKSSSMREFVSHSDHQPLQLPPHMTSSSHNGRPSYKGKTSYNNKSSNNDQSSHYDKTSYEGKSSYNEKISYNGTSYNRNSSNDNGKSSYNGKSYQNENHGNGYGREYWKPRESTVDKVAVVKDLRTGKRHSYSGNRPSAQGRNGSERLSAPQVSNGEASYTYKDASMKPHPELEFPELPTYSSVQPASKSHANPNARAASPSKSIVSQAPRLSGDQKWSYASVVNSKNVSPRSQTSRRSIHKYTRMASNRWSNDTSVESVMIDKYNGINDTNCSSPDKSADNYDSCNFSASAYSPHESTNHSFKQDAGDTSPFSNAPDVTNSGSDDILFDDIDATSGSTSWAEQCAHLFDDDDDSVFVPTFCSDWTSVIAQNSVTDSTDDAYSLHSSKTSTEKIATDTWQHRTQIDLTSKLATIDEDADGVKTENETNFTKTSTSSHQGGDKTKTDDSIRGSMLTWRKDKPTKANFMVGAKPPGAFPFKTDCDNEWSDSSDEIGNLQSEKFSSMCSSHEESNWSLSTSHVGDATKTSESWLKSKIP